MTLEITHKLKIGATTMMMNETNIFSHKALLSLHIARNQGHFERTNNCELYGCISYYTPEQYTIKIEIQYCSDQNFDLLFVPTEFAFNAWFGSLDRDKLLPDVTLGFLEKDLLPPEDSSFLLGIQLGLYNRR